jgi:hypothetical protein
MQGARQHRTTNELRSLSFVWLNIGCVDLMTFASEMGATVAMFFV